MIEDDPEFFIYHFQQTKPDLSLPLNSAKEMREAFNIHKEKLKDACYLMATCKVMKDVKNRQRRTELLQKRIQQLRDHMHRLYNTVDDVSRGMLYLQVNTDKYEMRK